MAAVLILTPDPANAFYDDLWREQGADLAAVLAPAGIAPAFAPWTHPLTLGEFDLVLPLLAWGYHNEPRRWAAFVDHAAAAGLPLANPPMMLRENTDKRYLAALAARGAPVAPMLACDAITQSDVAAARAHFGVDELIAKPVVSASAQGIVRLGPSDRLPVECLGRAMLIQPFFSFVVAEGEFSLFWFAGQYSHAILKTPAAQDFRIQHQFGGSFAAVTPPPGAVRAAEAVLGTLETQPLYARVDLIRLAGDDFGLIELELIEPDLFLAHAPDQGRKFAAAVAGAIG